MKGINLRINHGEKSQLTRKESTWQEPLSLADGSGYLGTLGVYHELHCIVSQIYRYHFDLIY